MIPGGCGTAEFRSIVYAQNRTVPMKRLIRNKLTQEYFRRDGSWTKDPAAASEFQDIRSIVRAEHEHQLQNVELVLLMGDKPDKYDIALSLGSWKRKNDTQ